MSIQAGLKERAYSIAEMASTPDQIKAAQRTLSQAVQDGTIPSYVGIPLINELNQKMAKASAPPAAPAQQQQPPIAQEVMAQAQADQGVPALPSNLPTEMAGGGIVAFSGGGETDRRMIEALLGRDDDETDDDYEDLVDAMTAGSRMPDISHILKMVEDENLPSDEGIESLSPVASKTFLTESPRGTDVENITKSEGDGTVQIKREKAKVSDSGDAFNNLREYVLHKESRGQRYDKNGNLLTSPKGAQGEMQVMPATQRSPGFGVTPIRNNSPDEIARVGVDVLRAMQKRYGDDRLALIAYNWGPGNTDKWLASGADPARLPAETRNYIKDFGVSRVAGMAGGGAVHFQNRGLVGPGGLADLANMTPEEIKDLARRRLRMEQARSAFSSMPQTPAAAPTAAPAAAPAATPAAARAGMGLAGRIAGPLGIANLGYEVGKNVLERKQNEEYEKYGDEPDLTPEEIERASKPAFMRDVSTSRKVQQERGIKPLAPLTYTPAGVKTYGPRPDYPPEEGTEIPNVGTTTVPTNVPAPAAPYTGSKKPSLRADISANLAQEDVDRASAGQALMQFQSEQEKPQAAAAEEPKSKLEQLLEARMGRLDKQREIDNYMALLAAGLGTLGGRSPYAFANIGEGGQAGIASYLRSGATRAAEENAILSGQLGLERYKSLSDIRKQGYQNQLLIKEMERELKKQVEAGKLTKAQEGQRLRAAEIARRMEADYLGRAETTARTLGSKNPLLSMDETKLNAFVQNSVAAARNRLNFHTPYRNLIRQAYDGYDPGELDIGPELEAAIARNLPKPK